VGDDPVPFLEPRDVVADRRDDAGGFDPRDVREQIDVAEPELGDVEVAVLPLDELGVHAVDATRLDVDQYLVVVRRGCLYLLVA
jgi:hypothetical protein